LETLPALFGETRGQGMFDRVNTFVSDVRDIESEGDLVAALDEITRELGFRYFALTSHTDVRSNSWAIRLHNYPDGWAEWFDAQQLGSTDPVHRASHLTSVGFAWSKLPEMIPLTRRDLQILAAARSTGIGDGFTVPAHVPGEVHGSCSFATEAGNHLPCDHLPLLQLVGAFAFEAARRVRRMREPNAVPAPRLTDRQRECVVWAARGKSDWEIAKILGVSHQTVIQHLKQARERYGVAKRTVLAVHALFDGTIAFLDVLRR
jgi:LuxR family quorum-sensing system transcriptional regulator CciR